MAAFPTLSKAPSYPIDPDGTREDAVLRSAVEGGYVQTRARFTRARRRWGLTYLNLPAADITTLRGFEATTLVNGADAFTWTHPISAEVVTVQLAAPIEFSTPRDYAVGDVRMLLQEV